MLKEQVEEAARLLCAARGGTPVHELPPSCRPQSDADAYEIQDAVTRQLGEAIGGWKVGAASAATRRVLRPDLRADDPSEPGLLRRRGAEADRHRGRDRLSPRPRSAGARSGLRSRRGDCRGVACIRRSRWSIHATRDFRSLDRPSILADNFSNGGLVYGAAVPGWEALDLGRTAITVTEDGEPFADSRSGAARDPVAALVDFVNLMSRRGGAKAGTIVTTGSWTGMVFTKRGAHIAADFGPLGRVEVAFPADE